MITAKQMLELKELVTAEINRRCASMYKAYNDTTLVSIRSIGDYSTKGATYGTLDDRFGKQVFEADPVKDGVIDDAQGLLVIEPLLNINDKNMGFNKNKDLGTLSIDGTIAGKTISKSFDYTKLSNLLAELQQEENPSYENSDGSFKYASSCRGVCTGLCTGTCISSCTGCTNNCTGNCGNNCTSNCGKTCTGCSGECTHTCGNSCIHDCGSNCVGKCNFMRKYL